MAETDSALAARLAAEAGELLRELRLDAGVGAEPAVLRHAGDRGAQRLIADELAEVRPADAVLSEEAEDDPARLRADRVWIIDPLDGTYDFAEGRPDWAVHVALWERGELTAGAVALPDLADLLRTDPPSVVPARAPGPVRIAVSRSRTPARVREIAAALEAELVPMGSAGYKVGAVVRGEVDAYVHAGGQYEWDSAAPVAVARAAGLHTSRIDGSPLRYNSADPYLPDLIVARPELAVALLTACAAPGSAPAAPATRSA